MLWAAVANAGEKTSERICSETRSKEMSASIIFALVRCLAGGSASRRETQTRSLVPAPQPDAPTGCAVAGWQLRSGGTLLRGRACRSRKAGDRSTPAWQARSLRIPRFLKLPRPLVRYQDENGW